MTLCSAWIRYGNTDEGEELVFATDSRLRGGEAWDNGIKLFDLGRSDCLLCFAGGTGRAYPLILHAGASIRSSVVWSNPRLDLHDILESLCQLFTELCKNITDLVPGVSPHEVRAEAEFMFGGWSWRSGKLCIWKLYYSPELGAFTHNALHENWKSLPFTFLGDYTDVAEQGLTDDLIASCRVLAGKLDMEPLRVLAKMARDQDNYPEIGGALQVAKVYRSGNSEFFGMIWPSVMNGRPYFLGRGIERYDAPPMRFIDPDTAAFTENLPTKFLDLENYPLGEEEAFVRRCYVGNVLKPDLPASYRERLERIFKDKAYLDFVARREQDPEMTAEQDEAGATSPGTEQTADA